ncbi:Plasmodium exported protein, unknown function [Plasmodium ovale wallikeri]|uniref:Uncharacterized protein n=1 Tax=Plasmodium ovale wallikeri TaxID=864142 RepID=A0A1A8YQY7_PLAOA|nr:Plasmodium exported protein, unknown function [Plasmodium ovale wallikeri]SBT34358.1 Plasmodium exported protein, unknown function [Plasmodium ovale wallikeri]
MYNFKIKLTLNKIHVFKKKHENNQSSTYNTLWDINHEEKERTFDFIANRSLADIGNKFNKRSDDVYARSSIGQENNKYADSKNLGKYVNTHLNNIHHADYEGKDFAVFHGNNYPSFQRTNHESYQTSEDSSDDEDELSFRNSRSNDPGAPHSRRSGSRSSTHSKYHPINLGASYNFSDPDAYYPWVPEVRNTNFAPTHQDNFLEAHYRRRNSNYFNFPEDDSGRGDSNDFYFPEDDSGRGAFNDFYFPEDDSSRGAFNDFNFPEDYSRRGDFDDFNFPATHSRGGVSHQFDLPEIHHSNRSSFYSSNRQSGNKGNRQNVHQGNFPDIYFSPVEDTDFSFFERSNYPSSFNRKDYSLDGNIHDPNFENYNFSFYEDEDDLFFQDNLPSVENTGYLVTENNNSYNFYEDGMNYRDYYDDYNFNENNNDNFFNLDNEYAITLKSGHPSHGRKYYTFRKSTDYDKFKGELMRRRKHKNDKRLEKYFKKYDVNLTRKLPFLSTLFFIGSIAFSAVNYIVAPIICTFIYFAIK